MDMNSKAPSSPSISTLEYITVPPCASPIHNQLGKHSRQHSKDLRHGQSKIRTSLPRTSSEYGPDSPSSAASSPTLKGFVANSTFNLLPQMLLSSSGVPTSPSSPSGAGGQAPGGNNPGRKRTKRYLNQKEPIVLLSNKDLLSIPIMSVNFKEFIQRVGPVFWLQDRIEEIVCWRRGWKMTCTWLSFYALICYFPKLIFVLPHIALIGIMLSTYSYPKPKPAPVPALFSAATTPPVTSPSAPEENADASKSPLPAPVAEDSVDWQANIQAIQNLMGAYAEAHTLVTPHLYHLSLAAPSSNSPNNGTQPLKPKSPYALPLLAFLVITLIPTLLLVSSPYFPTRLIAFIAGAGPVILLHPNILNLVTIYVAQRNFSSWVFTFYVPTSIRRRFSRMRLPEVIQVNQMTLRKKLKWTVQRVIDDNNLTDDCWNSEIREVELWENERLDRLARGRSVSADGAPSTPVTMQEEGSEGKGPQRTLTLSRIATNVTPSSVGWSKNNLKAGERPAWTRGRDGWSGVGADGSVSSNLTFALSAGWNFVSTEDWRADLEARWAVDVGGGDESGWVYTNDSWVDPQPFPYKAAATRRRRWVRRIWYDVRSLEKEKENVGGTR